MTFKQGRVSMLVDDATGALGYFNPVTQQDAPIGGVQLAYDASGNVQGIAGPGGAVIPLGGASGVIDYAKYTADFGYINTAGATAPADTNWMHSDFFPVAPGAVLNCSLFGHSAINSVSFYDASRVCIGGVHAANADSMFVQAVTMPATTAYFRLSFGNPLVYPAASGVVNTATLATTSANASIFDINSRLSAAPKSPFFVPRKLKLQAADKVLLYGDSISSTDYTWYQASMAALTGATVIAGGFSGATSAQLAANVKMQRIYDNGARLVIAMTGGNDNGAVGTVGSFSGAVEGEPIVAESSIAGDYVGTYFIQSISHIIRKFQASYGNIRARAGLTGAETESQKTAKIDAVLKPVLVFCTPLPQQRLNSEDQFSQAANWNRKRMAVLECCAKYKIQCIDLTNKVPFDMSAEPYWPGVTDMVTNNGVNTMDGLHPNKYGYQIISEIVCAEIGL